MLHYFFLDRRVRFTVLSLALAVMLAACGGEQPPTIDPDNTVSITHTEGTAMLVRATSMGDVSLPTSYLLAQGDQIYTSPDQSATLQFPDGSTLQLGPDSHILSSLFVHRITWQSSVCCRFNGGRLAQQGD
jgi:hypothetical protein